MKAGQPRSWQSELAVSCSRRTSPSLGVVSCWAAIASARPGLPSAKPAGAAEAPLPPCSLLPWLCRHTWQQPCPLTVNVSTRGFPSLPACSAVPSGSPSTSLLSQQVLDPSRSCRYANRDTLSRSSSSSNWGSTSCSPQHSIKPP